MSKFNEEWLINSYANKFSVDVNTIKEYNNKYGNFGDDVDLKTLSSKLLMDIILFRLLQIERKEKIKIIKNKLYNDKK